MADRNVLVVMTHDHGRWCVGAYGNKEVHTPTMDWLADTGVRMENGFCPTPMCSPARASFFTGLRASQHGLHDPVLIGSEYDTPEWLADETTLPELLGDAGYHTGLAGVWHVGRPHHEQIFDDTANLHGEGVFDYDKTGIPIDTSDDGETLDLLSTQRDERITEGALEFLRADRDDETPFFLFVGFSGVHPAGFNMPTPERLVEQYRGSEFEDIPEESVYRFGERSIEVDNPDEALAQYYGAVQGVDEQVGRLIDELDARDLLEETLVVYTVDHGHNCGHHGIWKKSNATTPPNMLEETIRVPLIFGGHEDLFDPQIRSEFVGHTDTFRTLLEFADVEAPDRNYPGESYLPQLLHAAGSADREQVQICEHLDVRMIRTERYKLVRRYHPDGPNLLFDLDADPRETRNRYADPEYEEIVEELTDRLEQEFETYSRPEASGVPAEDVDPTGTAATTDRSDG